VLRESRNFYDSLTHKGTSNVAQQADGAVAQPLTGEIDLMLYWTNRVDDWQGRTTATDEDCRGLISMAKVCFG
jgi:hypothetical protein